LTEVLCIICPLGCRLQVKSEASEELGVEGTSCKQGREYALQEATAPKRVLTTTLATAWGRPLPVRSAAPIAKGKVLAIQRRLARIVIDRAVAAGEVIIPDLDGQGTALIATAASQT